MNSTSKHFRIQKDHRTRSVRALQEDDKIQNDGVPLFPAQKEEGRQNMAERLRNLEDKNRTLEEKKEYHKRKYNEQLKRVRFSPIDNNR